MIKTDKAPDALEVKGKRAVVEGDVGEIETIQGGESKSGTFDLDAGSYQHPPRPATYFDESRRHYCNAHRRQATAG